MEISSLIMDYCPSCYQTLKVGAKDCLACGIVLENYQKIVTEKKLKLTMSGLYHLTPVECLQIENAWSKIETLYYDQNLHNQFLHLCLRLKSLPFAVKKYNDRILQDSLDDIASTMKNRAMLLASESLPRDFVSESWVPPVLAQALLRTLIVFLLLGVCAGSVLVLVSVLTVQKFFFLAMGVFVMSSCLLSVMVLLRLQRSLN